MEMGWKGKDTQCSGERWWQQCSGHGWSHIHVWWIRIGRNTIGVSDLSPRPYGTAQGSSTRKTNPYNFWLQKPVEGEAMEANSGILGNSD